ncbi:hypothetical protein I3842_07G133400 [Carya illinoinensis]|nr:hypothetical protein I3842_07G133400 [Carya illinoinensis]KAG6704431.1 hypothetical protein I3842_07G133400 [Carya illinoinensis]
MLSANCRSSSSSCRSPSLLSFANIRENGLPGSMLNMSPGMSSYFCPLVQSERSLPDQASLCWDYKKAVGCSNSIPSDGTPTPKSSSELREEIATLDVDIMHLERHILSLYRTAFEGHLSSDTPEPHLQYKIGSSPKILSNQSHQNMEPSVSKDGLVHHEKMSPAHGWVSSDNQSCAASLNSKSRRGWKKADSGHRCLADHLAASCLDNRFNSPDRLSEDIVRCISSIYCKLSNRPPNHLGLPASPISSLSSSTIFSSKNPCDSWSPHGNEDKEDVGPYAAMVEVLNICLDDDSYNFTVEMLQHFRSLVRCLEMIDPRRMKREEKLAFWINIHNALVMHAYLAYGIGNRVKCISILKAAYNVGGHCFNAHDIQSSILRIRSHHSASVRAYTAKNIFQDLRLAKENFIQASVRIHKEKKIFLPKILHYFAKDMSLSIQVLLETVSENLSEVQHKAIKKCMKGRLDKCIHWLPQSSTFRYVIHGELAEARTAS